MAFSGRGEKNLSKHDPWIRRFCAIWVLGVAYVCCAQTTHAPAQQSQKHSVATAHKRRSRLRRKKKAAKPTLPAEQAAQPATVSLKNGKLTVDANNSDLGQILKDVADISGMTIDGLDKSARIFGAYGPGSPSVVLSHLLAGSGYNFVMIGSRNDGVPRQLLLTAQNNNAPALPAANRPATVAATPQTQASAPIPADTDPRVPSTDAEQTEPSEAAPAQTDSPPPPAEETPEEPDSLHQQMHQLELQNMQQMQQTQQTPPQ